MRACVGSLIAITLTAGLTAMLLGPSTSLPLLIAPMGASAVLLFAVPASPLAQPWSLIGGNLVSALIGVSCAAWLGDSIGLAAAVAVALSIGAMFGLRCLHPPSGAVALTAVLGGPAIHTLGYGFAVMPVGLNSVLLLGVAIGYHRITGHRYPHAHVLRSERTATESPAQERLGFTRADLDAVLATREELLDIDVDDLEALLRAAELRAYGRRFSDLTAGQIMSRDVKAVTPETSADEAWDAIHRHGVKALPVVDAAHRVVGIVTQTDFVRHAGMDTFSEFKKYGVLKLISRRVNADTTVADIMTTTVRNVLVTQPIGELVPVFTDSGHHHLPVTDSERRLFGMVTQADLVAGLYRARVDEALLAA